MPRRRRTDSQPSQSWTTFLRDHIAETESSDFFVVPTQTIQRLFVFGVMSLDPRRILHVNVTRHPTSDWVAQQGREAFAGDRGVPRFLQRDRDGAFGWAFRQTPKTMGLRKLVSAPRSLWQNAYVERLTLSLRRECTDHIIPMSEDHPWLTLAEYVEYYNADRFHQGLDGESPIRRSVESVGAVAARPALGGLYRRFSRVA